MSVSYARKADEEDDEYNMLTHPLTKILFLSLYF